MKQIGRVLVIDDDQLQLEVTRDYLERRGISDVVCLNDGRMAARYLRASDREPINLVISDIHMPGFDGIELIGVMSTARKFMPLILVSGSGPDQLLSARVLAGGYELNVLGALRKPFDETQMDEAMLRHPFCRNQTAA